MIVLFRNDYSIRVSNGKWIYEYGELSPVHIRKVETWIKYRAFGKAWQFLRRFPLWNRRPVPVATNRC